MAPTLMLSCPLSSHGGKLKAAVERNRAACRLQREKPIIDIWPLMAKRCGRRTKQRTQSNQLSCYEVSTGRVLWHCNVQEKHNEISELKPLLTTETVIGRILSLDAMHTQRELCAQVKRLEGDYVLIAKDNQPTLREDIIDFFEDRTPDRRRWQEAETWDKGHGRLEHRHLVSSPDLNEWFVKEWQGIEQVFRIERTRHILKTGAIEHEVVYGLSSLSLQQAPAPRMLLLVRDHWKIENRLHWRRDVSLGEDACQTRTGSPPSLLAQIKYCLESHGSHWRSQCSSTDALF